MCVVELNTRGDAAKVVQRALILMGHLPAGQDDGWFGKISQTALRKWEGSKGDGKVSSGEFEMLLEIVRAKDPSYAALASFVKPATTIQMPPLDVVVEKPSLIELTLYRRAYFREIGTFGELTLPSGKLIYTCELSWRGNQPRISCIPEGTYTCTKRRYNSGGYDAYHVTNVKDREYILIHKGNSDENVLGCIAVGMHFPWWLGATPKPGPRDFGLSVGDSAGAFNALMEEMGGRDFLLTIKQWTPDMYEPAVV